jgi:hypothetical protein
MSPGIKYAFGRVGLFVVCGGLALLLLPHDWNEFLRLLVGAAVSMPLSFLLLRRWRDEVAEQLAASSSRRVVEKEKLRSALAGEPDAEPTASEPTSSEPTSSEPTSSEPSATEAPDAR